MQSRTETYNLTNGTGRIEVRGDGVACGLFLDGKPFVFNFYDCEGSIGQDLYRFAPLIDRNRSAELREVTTNLPPKNTILSDIVLPLLAQFAPGLYSLTLSPVVAMDSWIEYWLPESQRELPYAHSGYYPLDKYTLVATQPNESYDDARIAHFMYAIETGARPFAITATTDRAMCEFVLDGHHKMRAYVHSEVPPWRLCISQLESLPLAKSDWPEQFSVPKAWRYVHETTPFKPSIDRDAVRQMARLKDRAKRSAERKAIP